MNHQSYHLNPVDDDDAYCQSVQKIGQPSRIYQDQRQVRFNSSSIPQLGGDQGTYFEQGQAERQQTLPTVYHYQYQPQLDDGQYQSPAYVADAGEDSPDFYQPICSSQLRSQPQQPETIPYSRPCYVNNQPVQYIPSQPVNRILQVPTSRCLPVANVIAVRRLPQVIRQQQQPPQQFLDYTTPPCASYYHNHQHSQGSQQHQIRQQQQQQNHFHHQEIQQEPFYQQQDDLGVGSGIAREVFDQASMSQKTDLDTSHLYDQPQTYYTDQVDSRTPLVENNLRSMSQQVITVGRKPQLPLESPVTDVPSTPVEEAYPLSTTYSQGPVCINQVIESPHLLNSHQNPPQLSTTRLVSRINRGSSIQVQEGAENLQDAQSSNDQQRSSCEYNRVVRPQPSSPIAAKPQRRHHCRDLVDVRSNCGNIPQDWLDTICKQLIGDMERFGICVIDNFLGGTKGSLILAEVQQLYNSGQHSKGLLVSNKRSTQTLGEETAAAIRNDRVIWIDGCEEGCAEINNLIQTLCSVITNSSRLSLYSNNGLDKAVINKRTKAHVACYPGNGTRYIKHVDNPNGDGRVITCIYYLNKNWDTKRDGGLLRMFPAGMDEVANIEPLFDRALFFWSDRRNPHEVLPAYKNRFAITVWYISESRPT